MNNFKQLLAAHAEHERSLRQRLRFALSDAREAVNHMQADLDAEPARVVPRNLATPARQVASILGALEALREEGEMLDHWFAEKELGT